VIHCPGCDATHDDGHFNCPACGYTPAVDHGVPLLAPALAAQVEGFDPQAFAMLAAAEDGHFWFESRNRMIVHSLRRWFPDMHRYLEVGCGTGCVLAAVRSAFPQARITASEVLVAGLPFAATRAPGVELLQLDARALPYENEFDVIGAYDVLEHISEDETVLEQFRLALKDGGGVVLCVPQHPSLWSSQDDLAQHQRRYRRGELEAKLRIAGFTVLYTTSFMTVLLPLLWFARRRKHSKAVPLAQAHSELAPHPLMNTLLGGLLAIERALLRTGARLPIGSSRLVVATVKRPAA
jgi:SAM-dependent methyltransferase